MELRLQSKQTITIQVSYDCTLHTLKQTLLQTLGSSLPPDSVHLSLDRNDDLEESSSLQSLGINSGDLVFFTFNRTIERSWSIDLDLENLEPIGVVPKNCPKSILLSRVMKKHLGDDRNAHKLLVVAVHAVLLDSGLFPIARIDIPKDWPSTPKSTIGIGYTKGFILRFRSSLDSVAVYESIDFRVGSNVYQVTLDVTAFAPNLDSIWGNSMSPDRIIDENEWNDIERKMCELWKAVKDGLVLPMFMTLPYDVMLNIMKLLSGADIGKLQCVCNELWDLGNDKDLWRLKLHQEFPQTVILVLEDYQWKRKFGLYHRAWKDIRMEQNNQPPQPNDDQPPQPDDDQPPQPDDDQPPQPDDDQPPQPNDDQPPQPDDDQPPQPDDVVYEDGDDGEQDDDQPPQPNVVYGDGYDVWQYYIPHPWLYAFGPNPYLYAYGPYYYWGGQNGFVPHHGWQGQGLNVYYPHVQWPGQGQNAFDPHHGVQGQGQGQNAFDPHYGVQGRGQNAFDPHHGVQGQGRGQNAFDPHHGVQGQGRGQNAFDPHHGVQGQGRGRGRGQNAFNPHHGVQGRGRG